MNNKISNGEKYGVEYNSWDCMKQRCLNKKNPNYSYYGGRGISICDRWVNSFANFLEDMGRRPTPKHSLDRIDNSKGYSKDNCRWATRKEQTNNRRNNKNSFGIDIVLGKVSKELNGSHGLIGKRIKKGWSIERATTEKRNNSKDAIIFNGESMRQASLRLTNGKNENTVSNRVRGLGWSIEKAFNTPIKKYGQRSP